MKRIYQFVLLLTVAVFSACGGDDGIDNPTTSNTNDQDQDETTLAVDSNYVYQLPVIFHVLYQDKNDESQYIPAARLKNLLEYVNQIYQGGIYGESANAKLKFVLAETDEKGNKLSTPGVEYVYYPDEYPIDESDFMVSSANTKYIWDPNEYINVMMFHFKNEDEGEVLGLSHMPYTITGTNELEGLETTTGGYISKSQLRYPLCSSINSIYAGQSEKGAYYESDRYTSKDHKGTFITSADVVVTMAHELGHYLGLFHLFTEAEDGGKGSSAFAPADSCADTDHCKDTPSYNRSEYNSYLKTYIDDTTSIPHSIWDLLKRHACDGTIFYSANIMDYAFTLGYKISNDQKARIRNVLQYSPLIPGPKLNGANKRSQASSKASRGTSADEGRIYDRPRVIR